MEKMVYQFVFYLSLYYYLHLSDSRTRVAKNSQVRVKTKKKITFPESTTPLRKSVKRSNIDRLPSICPNALSKADLAHPKTQNRRDEPNVIIAAITWFSVKALANNPREINAEPISIKPI